MTITGETKARGTMRTTGTAMRDQDTITSIVTIFKSKPIFLHQNSISQGIGGTRGSSGLKGKRIIIITETIEIIIKIIIMKDISHLRLIIVIMKMMTGIINDPRIITTEAISLGMKGEEMIVIDLQTNTTKIIEFQITACLQELSK
jgi:hypothetical protein